MLSISEQKWNIRGLVRKFCRECLQFSMHQNVIWILLTHSQIWWQHQYIILLMGRNRMYGSQKCCEVGCSFLTNPGTTNSIYTAWALVHDLFALVKDVFAKCILRRHNFSRWHLGGCHYAPFAKARRLCTKALMKSKNCSSFKTQNMSPNISSNLKCKLRTAVKGLNGAH